MRRLLTNVVILFYTIGLLTPPLLAQGDSDLGFNAQFVSQDVPAVMTAGNTYSVSITMQNIGGGAWYPNQVALGSTFPNDNTYWGVTRVPLGAYEIVQPGEYKTFTFDVTPANMGTYYFTWRMVFYDTQWFGFYTNPQEVVVSGSPDGAAFVSHNAPEVMLAGQSYNISVTMQNSGVSSWSEADQYRLGLNDPQAAAWSIQRVQLQPGEVIAPGQNATWNFTVTAPQTVGDYGFEWQMIKEGAGWFGDSTGTASMPALSPENFFIDPGFESGSLTIPFDQARAGTLSIDTTTARSGAASMKFEVNRWNAHTISNTLAFPALEDRTLRFSTWAKVDADSPLRVDMYFMDAQMANLGQASVEFNLTTTWQEYSHLFSCLPGTAYAMISLVSPNSNKIFHLDDMALRQEIPITFSSPTAESILTPDRYDLGLLPAEEAGTTFTMTVPPGADEITVDSVNGPVVVTVEPGATAGEYTGRARWDFSSPVTSTDPQPFEAMLTVADGSQTFNVTVEGSAQKASFPVSVSGPFGDIREFEIVDLGDLISEPVPTQVSLEFTVHNDSVLSHLLFRDADFQPDINELAGVSASAVSSPLFEGIPPGGSEGFQVVVQMFEDASPGTWRGRVVLFFDDADDFEFTVKGRIPEPFIETDFAPVDILAFQSNVSFDFSVFNSGLTRVEVNLTQLTLSADAPEGLDVERQGSSRVVLLPGGGHTFEAKLFNSTEFIDETTPFTIEVEMDALDVNGGFDWEERVPLSIPARLVLMDGPVVTIEDERGRGVNSSGVYRFGAVSPNAGPGEMTFILTNDGNETLTIDPAGYAVSGIDNSSFAKGSALPPASLEPGQSQNFTVFFDPTGLPDGKHKGAVSFPTNALNGEDGVYSFEIEVTVVPFFIEVKGQPLTGNVFDMGIVTALDSPQDIPMRVVNGSSTEDLRLGDFEVAEGFQAPPGTTFTFKEPLPPEPGDSITLGPGEALNFTGRYAMDLKNFGDFFIEIAFEVENEQGREPFSFFLSGESRPTVEVTAFFTDPAGNQAQTPVTPGDTLNFTQSGSLEQNGLPVDYEFKIKNLDDRPIVLDALTGLLVTEVNGFSIPFGQEPFDLTGMTTEPIEPGDFVTLKVILSTGLTGDFLSHVNFYYKQHNPPPGNSNLAKPFLFDVTGDVGSEAKLVIIARPFSTFFFFLTPTVKFQGDGTDNPIRLDGSMFANSISLELENEGVDPSMGAKPLKLENVFFTFGPQYFEITESFELDKALRDWQPGNRVFEVKFVDDFDDDEDQYTGVLQPRIDNATNPEHPPFAIDFEADASQTQSADPADMHLELVTNGARIENGVEYDLGTVAVSGNPRFPFRLCNEGQSRFYVLNFQSTVQVEFGFAPFDAPPRIIEPNTCENLTVVLNTSETPQTYQGAMEIGPVEPSDPQNFQIRLKATSDTNEPEQASVRVETDRGPVQLGELFSFDPTTTEVPVEQSFTIVNESDRPVDISNFSVDGPFTLILAPPPVLPALGSAEVRIRRDFPQLGLGEGNVGFDFGFPPGMQSFSFPIESDAVLPINQPAIQVLDFGGLPIALNQVVDFGQTDQGLPVLQDFSIVNNGAVGLNVTFMTQNPGGGFTMVDPPALPFFIGPIPSNEPVPFSIELDATAIGRFNGIIYIDSSDPNVPLFTFRITGQVGDVIEPPVADSFEVTHGPVTPVPHNSEFVFDETQVGTFVGKNFRIWNMGTKALNLSAADFIIPEGYQLIGVPDAPIPPPDPDGTVHWDNFSVHLTAEAAGLWTGNIIISNSDGFSPNPYVIQVRGNVVTDTIAPEGIRVTQGVSGDVPHGSLFPFGTTDEGTFIGFPFRIYNETSGPLTILAENFTIPAGFQLINVPAVPIPPPDPDGTVHWDNFAVHLTADQSGEFMGLLSFTALDGSGNPLPDYTFTVTGTVNADPCGDTVKPTITIDQPAAGAVLDAGDVTISFSPADSGSGIKWVRLKIDGDQITNLTAPYTYVWDATPGPHTIEGVAVDNCGNTRSASVSVTINTTTPSTVPGFAGTIGGQDLAGLTVYGPDHDVVLTWQHATDLVPIAAYQVVIQPTDGSGWLYQPQVNYPATTTTIATMGLIPGMSYSTHIRAKNVDNVWGPWSQGGAFTVEAAPVPPAVSNFVGKIGGVNLNGLTVAVLNPLIQFSWTHPSDPTGIEQYQILLQHADGSGRLYDERAFFPDNTLSLQTAGLAHDTSYTIHIRAKNNFGSWGPYVNGGAFTVQAAAPETVPGFVGTIDGETIDNLTIYRTDPTLNFNWSHASDPNGIAKYNLRVLEAGVSGVLFAVSPDYPATSASIATTNLVVGKTYSIHIRAQNNAGLWGSFINGGSFTVQDPPVPGTVPNFVGKIDGTNLDGQTIQITDPTIAFSWNHVSDPTGIEQYQILLQHTDGSGRLYDERVFYPGNTLTLNTTGLTYGKSYSIHIRAKNNFGNWGNYVNGGTVTVEAPTPGTVPNFAGTIDGQNVAGLTVYQTNPTINFSWSHVSDPSGIAQYNIRVLRSGVAGVLFATSPVYPATSASIATTGLEEGVSYSIHIRALNNAGNWGPFVNGGVFTVQPPPVPGTVPNFVGKIGGVNLNGMTINITNPTIAFTWNHVSDPTGIEQYQVLLQHTDGSGRLYDERVFYPGKSLTLNTSGLTYGKSYSIHIRAKNNFGNWGAYVNGGTLTVEAPTPGTVPNFSGTIGGQNVAGLDIYETNPTINFSWSHVSDPSGIAQYNIRVLRSGVAGVLFATSPNYPATSASIATSGLEVGVSYSIHIRALNNAGNWGPFNNGGVFTVQPPPVPGTVPNFVGRIGGVNLSGQTIDITNPTIAFSWSHVSDPTGIEQYQVLLQHTDGSGRLYDERVFYPGSSLTLNTSGLTYGKSYSIHIRAKNNFGNWGAYVNGGSFTVVTPTPPAVPNVSGTIGGANLSGLDVYVTNPTVTMSWTSPADPSGIERYQIVIQPTDGSGWLYQPQELFPATSTTINTSGLVYGKSYSTHVRAKNNAGNWGPWASGGTFSVVEPVPTTVPNFSATIGGQSVVGLTIFVANPTVSFSWSHASDPTGIERYQIVIQPTTGGWLYQPQVLYPATSTSIATSGLQAGVSYSVHIRAKNNFGNWGTWVKKGNFTVQR